MFKKRYSLYLIILLLGIGVGFAETGGKTLQEKFEATREMNYLNQAGVYFLNEVTQATPKEFNLSIEQEETKELSLLLKNESKEDFHLRIEFADQAISNGGTLGCTTEYSKGFSDFITVPRKGDILIPAGSQETQKIKVKFPVGIEGIQKGCLTYGVREDIENAPESMIGIITRKILFLNALIGGTGEINYKIDKKTLIKKINEKDELELGIEVENIGNVDSNITIEGTISNALGFERPIVMSDIIAKGEKTILSTNIGKLPFYKGFFNIILVIKDKPEFEYDAEKFGIDPEIIAGGEQTIKMRYFQRHGRMFIAVSILLILLIILYRRFKKSKKKKKLKHTKVGS